MELTEFERKIWVLANRSPSLSKDEFFASLSQFMPPTCGVEQRLFLDEVEKFIFNNLIGGYVPEHGDSMLFQSEFESDIEKVIKGE